MKRKTSSFLALLFLLLGSNSGLSYIIKANQETKSINKINSIEEKTGIHLGMHQVVDNS